MVNFEWFLSVLGEAIVDEMHKQAVAQTTTAKAYMHLVNKLLNETVEQSYADNPYEGDEDYPF